MASDLFHTEKGELTRRTVEGCNPHNTGFEQSVLRVHTLITDLLASSHLKINQIMGLGIGVSGLGRENDKTKWADLFMTQTENRFNHLHFSIDHDAMIALYSGTYGGRGIVSINGTGSICFGATKTQTRRAGGWGHLINADPGSGYFIGAQALSAVFNAYDGTGKQTGLTDVLLTHFKEQYIPNIITHIYTEDVKVHIASLAKLTLAAATDGDDVAREVVELTSKHIVNNAQTVYNSLFDTDNSVKQNIPLVLIGGIFKNQHLRQTLHEHLSVKLPEIKPLYPRVAPTYGSIVLVLKKYGYEIPEIQALFTRLKNNSTNC